MISLFDGIDATIGSTVPYLATMTASFALYVVSTTYGAWALVTFIGAEEGERLLADGEWGWKTWYIS